MVTRARRSGIEYITPRMPPSAHTANDVQNGKPVHQPIITRPGRTKINADRVPAAEATVWTILFSWIVAPLKARSTAIEITAAGIEEANVSPAFSPKATFAAVNTTVIKAPRIRPRQVSSLAPSGLAMSVMSGPPQCEGDLSTQAGVHSSRMCVQGDW